MARGTKFQKGTCHQVGFEQWSSIQRPQTLRSVSHHDACEETKDAAKRKIRLYYSRLPFVDNIKVTPTHDFFFFFCPHTFNEDLFFSVMFKLLWAASSHTDRNSKLSCQVDLFLVKCDSNSTHSQDCLDIYFWSVQDASLPTVILSVWPLVVTTCRKSADGLPETRESFHLKLS